ncbi:uncharacterized protein BJ212DRAFT_1593046 [Suillus subaureus]|uniref:Uncharacterized protein n=1 Tax=Suillus subaureus TaxID=48587 RepID=A0A9P7DFV7_9AGAM|nr:uncharacterized protein BJ212DRAFT_1593046 [Suillus subaureus]KAG1791778.1 hypothetical protein BJ212DRAFT_1593046 [Suillus subaureus]
MLQGLWQEHRLNVSLSGTCHMYPLEQAEKECTGLDVGSNECASRDPSSLWCTILDASMATQQFDPAVTIQNVIQSQLLLAKILKKRRTSTIRQVASLTKLAQKQEEGTSSRWKFLQCGGLCCTARGACVSLVFRVSRPVNYETVSQYDLELDVGFVIMNTHGKNLNHRSSIFYGKEKKDLYYQVTPPMKLVQKQEEGHIPSGSLFSVVGCVVQLAAHACR